MSKPVFYPPEVGPPSTADAQGPERVWAAAIEFAGRIWVAPCHIDATVLAAESTGREVRAIWAESLTEGGQGFILTSGKFTSRRAAWEIAERNGQINHAVVTDPGTLFSEYLNAGHYAERRAA